MSKYKRTHFCIKTKMVNNFSKGVTQEIYTAIQLSHHLPLISNTIITSQNSL